MSKSLIGRSDEGKVAVLLNTKKIARVKVRY
jgi:hypothetical protein